MTVIYDTLSVSFNSDAAGHLNVERHLPGVIILCPSLHETKPLSITLASGEVQEIPLYLITSKIPYIKQFLSLVVSDWLREASPKQAQIDLASQKGEPVYQLADSIFTLGPIFLKCLFSYAFFFSSADTAYINIYESIARVNSDPKLRLKHPKPPKKPEKLEKLLKVRHWCIAHIGDVSGSLADELYSMYWSPVVLSKQSSQSWDINHMSFGAMKVKVKNKEDGSTIESTDLELENIPRLHELSSEYLSAFDKVCVEYIEIIREKK